MSKTQLVRTRFAPSPTGALHLGGARTALFAFLCAKKHHGQFILRIEDTDLARSTQASTQALLDGLKWLELDYDEGPFYQTERSEYYQAVMQTLLNENKAYRCYCSKERLESLRKHQLKNQQKPRYDGHCRDLKTQLNKPFCLRFKNPERGVVTFVDQIKGSITIANHQLDDFILARSDGTPTYNFTVVVDDHEMQITHVIRGDDHINNTPRQINLYQALGYPLPHFAHLPMILGSDGKRLSKRHGALSVMEYQAQGLLPQALLNHLLRLGWSYGDQEIFSREQMIALFDLKTVQRSGALFDPKKLLWLNQHYIKSAEVDHLAELLEDQLKYFGIVKPSLSHPLTAIVQCQQSRSQTLREMAKKSVYFFKEAETYDAKAANRFLNPESLTMLKTVYDQLAALNTWQAPAIHSVILNVSGHYQVKLGKVAQPIRVAITGHTVSPPIDVTLELLGQITTLKRLSKALTFMNKK